MFFPDWSMGETGPNLDDQELEEVMREIQDSFPPDSNNGKK